MRKIKKFFFRFDKIFLEEKYFDFRKRLSLSLKDFEIFTFFSELLKNSIDHSKKGWLLILVIQRRNYKMIFFISRSICPIKGNSFPKKRRIESYKIGLPTIKSIAKKRKIRFKCLNWNYVGSVRIKKC